jgi:plastocyanin
MPANMPMGQSQSTDTKPEATNQVVINNFAFSPANITVKKGTTVTWMNNDSTTHTVTENDGQKGPDSGDLATGKSYSFTFESNGTFKYHCAIHPEMTGTVIVTD